MSDIISLVAKPTNEPVLSFAPGTPEREQIKHVLRTVATERRELPLVVGGKALMTEERREVRAPHAHDLVLATRSVGTQKEVTMAVEAATKARAEWSSYNYDERAAVFLKAAELLAGPHRARINATTMLCQSKTVHQAEIDAACELIDFWRFNVYFGRKLLEEQPLSVNGIFNRLDYRPLDGFVLAVSPFNFTSIAGNLPTAPALMGNTVLWKPARTQALSAQVIMDVLLEAGLPDGVINLLHCSGAALEPVMSSPHLAGIHFTGSTPTFQNLWKTVGNNLSTYRSYPRLVGETGGKDFIFAHPSADVEALATAIVRGGFEYQGQKCSAASRIYVPKSLWGSLSERVEALVCKIGVGDITDFTHFMGAVIDKAAFDSIKAFIDHARDQPGGEVWLGGNCDDSRGYFIEPTVVLADEPKHKLMCDEIFGPVVTIYRYADSAFEQTLKLCDETSPYALTGAIFAQDPAIVRQASEILRFAAGNFYINDKPTGAVVGQQPFGGGRASGTNDKAGSVFNLVRWVSPRTIKENFNPPKGIEYPYMQAE